MESHGSEYEFAGISAGKQTVQRLNCSSFDICVLCDGTSVLTGSKSRLCSVCIAAQCTAR
jgi:hypothetical protein